MEAAGVELSGEHDFTLAATTPEEELEHQTLGDGARSEQLAQFFSGVGFDFRLGVYFVRKPIIKTSGFVTEKGTMGNPSRNKQTSRECAAVGSVEVHQSRMTRTIPSLHRHLS